MEKQKSDPFLIIDHDGTKVDFVRKICIGIARSIVVIVSQLYGVFPHLVFMLLLRPFKSTIPNLYWYLEGIGYRGLLLLAASWQWSAGYTGRIFSFFEIFIYLFLFWPIWNIPLSPKMTLWGTVAIFILPKMPCRSLKKKERKGFYVYMYTIYSFSTSKPVTVEV